MPPPDSLNADGANAAIRHVVASLLGLDPNLVRKDDQNAPTGLVNQPFTTVHISEYTPVGHDNRVISDEGVQYQLTETIAGTRFVSADIQSFRLGANNQLSRLKTLLTSSSAMGLMHQQGIALVACGQVRNTTDTIDTYWEERALVTLTCYVTAKEVLTISTFSKVDITIQTEDVSITREVNLDVDS